MQTAVDATATAAPPASTAFVDSQLPLTNVHCCAEALGHVPDAALAVIEWDQVAARRQATQSSVRR
eukprot:5300024-Pleurochrysis_carterae.AAC.1